MSSLPNQSSSISSSLHASSPFSRLPAELVQYIVHHASPHPYHVKTYKTRVSTLHSLCLVSKLFHQLARPRLVDVVKLEDDKTLELWQQKSGGSRRDDSTMLVMNLNDLSLETSDLSFLLRLQYSLKTLVLTGGDGVDTVLDMRVLPKLLSKSTRLNEIYYRRSQINFCLSGLTTLRLHDVTIKSGPGSGSPSLVELTVLDADFVSYDGVDIFTPSNFPKLRALGWWVQRKGRDAAKMLESLIDHLEVLFVDPADVQHWSPQLFAKAAKKTLFDLEFKSSQGLPSVPSLRFFAFNNEDGDDEQFAFQLNQIASHISNSPSHALPSLIYLPAGLKDYYDHDVTPPPGRFSLKRECEQKKIGVVFDERVRDVEFDSLISRHFWRRVKGGEL